MGRGKELSDFQRGTVVGCHICNKSVREISALLNLPRSTVSYVIRNWKNGGITTALPRSGRPHKLKEEQRQMLERVAMETCLTSIQALTAEFQNASGAKVSSKTIRRELRDMGYRGRVSSYRKTTKGEKVKKKQEDHSQEVDVSRLDLRVGRVITAGKIPHEDGDDDDDDGGGLYMELIDVGEASPRKAVSNLAKHIPLDQMQNRMVVVLCNLSPFETRGVESQAVILCARSADKVEIIEPPSWALPGERVTFQQFPGEPDEELKPELKVWEQVQSDLRTDAHCVAIYKGAPFEVSGKGVCKAQTMIDCEIK
ncbi:aminoacyl tRNA synthase complex-interacting multifunctional protein 1-like isoform 2-T2 [Pholidichthys leucotaenia]